MLVAACSWWIGSIIFLIIWVAIAFWPARVAARKGHSFLLYFLFNWSSSRPRCSSPTSSEIGAADNVQHGLSNRPSPRLHVTSVILRAVEKTWSRGSRHACV
jgi:hypothetical protein